MCPLIPTASNGLAVHAPLHECPLHRVNGRNVSAPSTKYATVCLRVWGDSECLASELRENRTMPRIPGEEGKKKEPPAYTGDPYVRDRQQAPSRAAPGFRRAADARPTAAGSAGARTDPRAVVPKTSKRRKVRRRGLARHASQGRAPSTENARHGGGSPPPGGVAAAPLSRRAGGSRPRAAKRDLKLVNHNNMCDSDFGLGTYSCMDA